MLQLLLNESNPRVQHLVSLLMTIVDTTSFDTI